MPAGELLSEQVRALVRQRIPTPLHLEALVRLAREPGRCFTPADILTIKYTDVTAVERSLQDLVREGVAVQSGPEARPCFSLAAVSVEEQQTLALLVVAYDRMPVQLVRAVYERPPEAVQSFADAFRLRKK